MDIKVRGSLTLETFGLKELRPKPDKAEIFSPNVRALYKFKRAFCSSFETSMGKSLLVSTPPAMPCSMAPLDIFKANCQAVSSPVPQAL